MIHKDNLEPEQANIATMAQKGKILHQQGNFAEAQVVYEQILKIQPDHFDALQLLGVLFAQIKKYSQAIEFLSKALEINPNHAVAYSNRGIALKELKRFDEALASYDQAIAINTGYLDAYSNRGNLLQELKRFDEALNSYDQVLKINPEFIQALYNRGTIFQELKRFDEALNSYDQAIKINPDYAEAYSDRGVALKKLERFDEALNSYDQAIKINPHYAEAYYNRGNALKELEFLDEALANYDQAIAINPDYVEAHYNRGVIFQMLKDFDEALSSYDQAIKINPKYVSAHWNKSVCNLIRGNFKSGWQDYEWRWGHFQCDSEPLKSNKPLWDYQKTDQRLLVWAEQGVGDQILFGSLLVDLLNDVPNLLVQVDKRLIPIFSRSLPKIKYYPSANLDPNSDSKIPESDYDIHVPIGSLGKYLRNDVKDFDGIRHGFLKDDKAKTVNIKKDLLALVPFKNKICGISWLSKSKSSGDSKNIALKYFIKELDLKGYSFVSLQYGTTKDEIKNVKDELGINIISYEQVDNFLDIDGLSSLIQACDTVISVDNITCQLAGALGKEIYILLTYESHWAWMLDRRDCLWWPSVKLYRQEKINDWEGALEKLNKDLLKFIS